MEVSKLNINGTEYTLRDDSKLPQPEGAETGQLLAVKELDENGRIIGIGTVKQITVNGTAPDENGNVQVTSTCSLEQPEWGKRATGTYKAIPGEYVEGASRTLLWENASLTSGFPAQSITLTDLPAPEASGGYTHIEVEFGVCYSRYANDGDVRTVVRIPYCVDFSSKTMICGRAFAPCYSAGPISYSRDFRVRAGEVYFTEGKKLQASTVSNDNTALVPYKIYGIK